MVNYRRFEVKLECTSLVMVFKDYLVPEILKGDRVISPALRAKNTTKSGRNDAVTLYFYTHLSYPDVSNRHTLLCTETS